MTRPAASCELWVDGARFADSAADYRAGIPTAVEGLKLTWGRGTTVDQPETSTVSIPISDLAGASTFLDVVPVDSKLEIYAAGVVPGVAGNVAADPGFETLPPADRVYAPAALSVSVAAAGPTSGAGIALANLAASTPSPAAAVIAPDAFSDSITAWDHIPTLEPGVGWAWSVAVRAGPGLPVTITPVALAGPDRAGAASPTTVGTAATVTGDGTTVTTLSGTTDPASPARGWLALSVSITAGRTWDAAPGSWDAAVGSWDARGTVALDALSLAAPALATRRVQVWGGTVSDLSVAPDGETGGTAVEATGVDPSADLGNRYVGDAPWTSETLTARASRILSLSGAPLTIVVAATLAPLLVSRRDVDRQPALGLLTELAETGDGVLWPAVHATTGVYLWIEDPNSRAPARELSLIAGVVVIVGSGGTDVTRLSAADLLNDPTRFTQDVTDVVTRTDVTWLDQTTSPDPTERTVSVVDAAAEAGGTAHRVGRSTQLTTAGDATTVANRIMARAAGVPWRVTNLTWDTATGLAALDSIDATDRANALMDLLDGTRRAGRPILLTDLPSWTPNKGADLTLYLEGGSYEFTGGAWILNLIVSPSQAIGRSVRWNELDPAWTWQQFHPSITWADLIGTGA